MSYKIGIPRALMYHYYYPAWERFFLDLGMDVILSPETNKKILDDGVKRAVDDLCLPFKVYYGHVLQLLNHVDYIFVPRLISLGKHNAVCPKFMGLPDMVRATFKKLPPLIEPAIDLRKGLFPLRKVAHQIGEKLKVNYLKVEWAYWRAVKRYREFERIQKKGYTPSESMKILKRGEKEAVKKTDSKKQLKVALLGHSYITNDKHISMDMIKHLNKMGVRVITLEMLEEREIERAASQQPKKLFWIYNRQVMGSAYHLIYKEKVDGIIQVTAFGCGPDSLVSDLVEIRGKEKGISILNINLDEHSGQAGLITRLEAFVDLLKRRRLA